MNAAPQRKRPLVETAAGFDKTQEQPKHSTARNMLPPGSKFCQCSGCREYFTAPSAFDHHRVGKYEVTSGPDRRRCLAVTEMQLAGWRKTSIGYWTNREAFNRASAAGALKFISPFAQGVRSAQSHAKVAGCPEMAKRWRA